MSSGNTYTKGQTVRMTGTFKVGGVATDPTTVSLTVETPAGTQTTYTYALGTVTKSATGIYYKDVALSVAGEWCYGWTGTGTAAGFDDARISVTPSLLD